MGLESLPEGSPFIEACAIVNVMNFQPLVDFVNLPDLNIIQFCIFLSWIRLSNGGVCCVFIEKSLCFFFISLFGLSAILKIRNGEHTYYVGLVVAYNWNREKQMLVALGKEFDMWRDAVFLHEVSPSVAPKKRGNGYFSYMSADFRFLK